MDDEVLDPSVDDNTVDVSVGRPSFVFFSFPFYCFFFPTEFFLPFHHAGLAGREKKKLGKKTRYAQSRRPTDETRFIINKKKITRSIKNENHRSIIKEKKRKANPPLFFFIVDSLDDVKVSAITFEVRKVKKKRGFPFHPFPNPNQIAIKSNLKKKETLTLFFWW